MRRREFITLIGSTAAAWPRATWAQAVMPTIGYLEGVQSAERNLAEFRRGLSDNGYVEGRNVTIQFRSAEGRYEQLPTLVAEMVHNEVTVIYIHGSQPGALAAKAATTTIPIVFANGSDPVASGLVKSLNRPGGNVTGVTFLSRELLPKRLELLRTLVPQAKTIALLVNPTNRNAKDIVQDVQRAAQRVGQQIAVFHAGSAADIDAAFVDIDRASVGGLLFGQDLFFFSQRDRIVALAERYKLPAVYFEREMAESGGLMSYAADQSESFRQAGTYVGRILKGEKPADLPVLQPTKFELIINLKTAKSLGITVPLTLQVAADEVIE